MCATKNYSFINHVNIDRSCLHNSKIHLNAKGYDLLAVINVYKFHSRKETIITSQPVENFLVG